MVNRYSGPENNTSDKQSTYYIFTLAIVEGIIMVTKTNRVADELIVDNQVLDNLFVDPSDRLYSNNHKGQVIAK